MQNETPAPDKLPVRILIVDDEPAQMKALCDTLRDRGYVTTGFTVARAALEELKKRSFDLVLTDLMMPDLDGIGFLKCALDKDPALVGIIMTGEGTIGTAVEAMKSGAFDYILKPFRLSVILPVLARAMSVRRLRAQNLELEEGIRQRTAELELANKELEAFSYSVSHDLRAPLRHIIGYWEALREDSHTQFSEEGRRFFDSIGRSSQKMTKLIDDLLAFARLGKTEMQQGRFDMGQLVQEILTELASDIDGRNIEWDIQPLPKVRGDRALLKQVWLNLLANAVKYTRPRNPARISVSATEKKGEWEFHVHDNGVGFDMSNVGKLFGVFQRLHTSSEFEGTGVGLANVRRLVTRHGGRTWAEGKVNEGATIYFTLPAEPLGKSDN